MPSPRLDLAPPYLLSARLRPDALELAPPGHPFDVPLVATLDLTFRAAVTFFVGENGSGKSTVLEALAVQCGLPAGGGGRNELATQDGAGRAVLLADALQVAFRKRPRGGYFFRAQSQVDFARLLDVRKADPDFTLFGDDPYERYGGRSLNTRSHGEAFLDIFKGGLTKGMFLVDEPEAALSPARQLALLALMAERVRAGSSQFIVATHSPIMLTFPGARVLAFEDDRVAEVEATETEHYQLTRDLLNHPERYWQHLLADDDQSAP